MDVLNRRLQGSHGKLLVDLGDLDLDASFPPEAVQAFRDVLAAYNELLASNLSLVTSAP